MGELASFVNGAIVFALLFVGALLVSLYSVLSGRYGFGNEHPSSHRLRDMFDFRYIRERQRREEAYVDEHVAGLSATGQRNVRVLSVASLLWVLFVSLLIPLSPIHFIWWSAFLGVFAGVVPVYGVYDVGRKRGRADAATDEEPRPETGPTASA